ncbi:hypothetical protein [Ciceribacter azotifigens]|uniref:hypothetical protein n=1 Tax=Ciceribacter azotifigens TaxID=2069303 RepID=UPI003A87997B
METEVEVPFAPPELDEKLLKEMEMIALDFEGRLKLHQQLFINFPEPYEHLTIELSTRQMLEVIIEEMEDNDEPDAATYRMLMEKFYPDPPTTWVDHQEVTPA